MTETDQVKRPFELRAKLPGYIRIAALTVLVLTVLAIAAGFYRERNKTGFKLKSEHARLSTDVIAEVNDYERLESDAQTRKYFIKADHAKTFSDNHQELDKVYIEVYGDVDAIDKLSADRALYVPEEDRNFTAYLTGNVGIETRDSLMIKTSNIVYTRRNETAEADDHVEFERGNIKGSAFGATVEVAQKRLELLRDVEVEMVENSGDVSQDIKSAVFKGSSAIFDQARGTLEVKGGVKAHIVGGNSGSDRNTDIKSERAVAVLSANSANSQPSIHSIELVDNVWIETTQNGVRQSTIETAYGFYDRSADQFDLKNGVHIVTGGDDPADIRSAEAIFEQKSGNVRLSGGAELTRGPVYLRGDILNAALSNSRKVKRAVVSGSAFLRNSASERTTEISANELNADFDEAQQVQNANAVGNAKTVVNPTDNSDYTSLNLLAPAAIHVSFRSGGLPDKMKAEGRTTLELNVPNNSAGAANKRVIADVVNVAFNENGKDLRHAEAIGNAELYIEPIRTLPENYHTTIFAPRFDCEFYSAGNNARSCTGGKHTNTVREPMAAGDKRATQTLVADSLMAVFSEASKDLESLLASGQGKFTELDKNAVAASMTFTQSDQTVRMRGGEPTFWDSNSRAKAPEIDWDTRGQKSYLRSGVSTTYYSRKTTGDAAPFGNSEKPVFITSLSAEIDHRTETATFSGNARAWQDNNYVRADRLVIDQQSGRFNADGSVQSLLYEAKQRRRSANENIPAYASAASMNYSRDSRVLQYRGSVDLRQGTDRVTAQNADIYLNDKNELVKTVVENGVVITQPGRKATGDRAEYASDDDIAVIRGNPARVDDAENGTSQSGQITVYLRDNRMLSEGPTKRNPTARTRSVYKVKNIQ